MSLLSDIGKALYGARWQSELARALGVDDRTVRRWVAGEFNIPPGIFADLAVIARTKREELGSLLPKLDKAGKAE